MSFTKQQEEFLYEWALIYDDHQRKGKLDKKRLERLNKKIKKVQKNG